MRHTRKWGNEVIALQVRQHSALRAEVRALRNDAAARARRR